MDTARYLSRIGIDQPPHAADEAALRLLQRQHLQTVPFENLDIHWKVPIELDTAKFYDKVVVRRRGGFCYELNGLFNALLRELGFQTRLVSARVHINDGTYGPEFDHAAIIVTIDDIEYLADVGFGDFTAEPLRFVLDGEQTDAAGMFVIRPALDAYLEVVKRDGDGWASEYIFKDLARDLSEFAEMCDFQQYSRDSHFTKRKVCSLMTPTGRKTLTDKSFIRTEGTVRDETEIGSDDEFQRMLHSEFGITREEAVAA